MNKLNQLYKWIANDGLLHILICIVIMLSLQPIIGYLLSLFITIIFAGMKEIYDYYIQKDNTIGQIKHDIICNGVGIIISSFVILLYHIID